MSERGTGVIHIGGSIRRDALPLLLAALHEEGLGLDWGELLAPHELKDEAAVLEALNQDGHLCLMNPHAIGGMFSSLETTCKNLNIAFNRYSDALLGQWDAEVAYFRTGNEEIETLITNGDTEPVVCASVAIKAFRALRAGNVHAALTALEPYAEGYEVPPLPPLQIVDKIE